METIIGTIAGIIFGGLLSFLVSRHFYQKSVKQKKLSCFVQFVSEILKNIDPQVKSKLKVEYESNNVESLYQVQFVIANTGDIPISGVIKPLELSLPSESVILDYEIIHIYPVGREIAINLVEPFMVCFNFPLLNPNEYFIAKLLVKGDLPGSGSKEDTNSEEKKEYDDYTRKYGLFRFTISSDELPPTINSEQLPTYYVENGKDTVDRGMKIFAFVLGVLSLILTYSLFCYTYANSEYFLFNFREYFSSFNLPKLAILFSWLICFILWLFTCVAPFAIASLNPWKGKPKFHLPKNVINESSNNSK
jgi:hypothetical protein